MDSYLQHSLATGSPPFAGQTICPTDLLPLDQLASVLTAVITRLQAKLPTQELLRHEDWHEHDGYITSSLPITWVKLLALVASPEGLYAERPHDDFVRIGVYGKEGTFYLRIWVPDKDDDPQNYPGRWGSFDLSAPEELIVELQRALPSQEFVLSGSKSFFEERSAA